MCFVWVSIVFRAHAACFALQAAIACASAADAAVAQAAAAEERMKREAEERARQEAAKAAAGAALAAMAAAASAGVQCTQAQTCAAQAQSKSPLHACICSANAVLPARMACSVRWPESKKREPKWLRSCTTR